MLVPTRKGCRCHDLADALRFYANPEAWEDGEEVKAYQFGPSSAEQDAGAKAREALKRAGF